jgi:hypothetical protein
VDYFSGGRSVPPFIIDANVIKELAVFINKDIYSTRLLFTRKIPRIIAHYQTIQKAESIAQSLRHLGLMTIVCRDAELRQNYSSIFRACNLRFGQREIVFQNSSTTRIIKTEDVFLILKGIIQSCKEKEGTKIVKKLNLGATLLTGIPVRHKVEEKILETSIPTEYFIRLYSRKSPNPDVEITQYGFDYSCLGVKMAPTTFTNFNTLLEKIKELCPRSVFDGMLTESPEISRPSTISRNNNDILCKLIYLYHTALNKLDSSV